jgi:UDP-3-O-[3-hydroxymyristoyl] glucosamine N-acyltransferase
MHKVYIADIIQQLGDDAVLSGEADDLWIDSVKTPANADEHSLIWIKPGFEPSPDFFSHTRAKVILCRNHQVFGSSVTSDKCFILYPEPKQALIKILNTFFKTLRLPGIHHSAIIDPLAVIHPDAHIGAGCSIGKSIIGAGCILEGNVFVYDNVTMGENVVIQAGAVIGSDGFGHTRLENGSLDHFPHIGGVDIGDNVQIGSNACIDRGVLGNTMIGNGTKLNSLAFVAHNVEIGEDNLISVGVLINGSAVIGHRNFIGTGANIRNKVKIGNDNTIGMGSVIIKNIENNKTVVGNPGKEVEGHSGLKF